MRAKVRLNSEAEEKAIQRGIAADPDNPERDDAFFASARLATEAVPEVVSVRRFRGPGRREAKALVTLRLDRDVVASLRASGPGWQGRVNEALRKLVG